MVARQQVGCRVNSGSLIVRAAPFDPEKFIGPGWSMVANEQDAASFALREVDFASVVFATRLRGGECAITGEENLQRLRASGRIRYGASVFLGLWLDYQTRKENSVLERLYHARQITYLDFFGDVLRHPDGGRYVLCLYRGRVGWRRGVRYLGCSWRASHVSAVSPAGRRAA